MDSIWLEYGWTLLILIGLEGILSADNALVLAIIAKHLPDKQKKHAIDYGIYMAFVFRFISIFLISFLTDIWQVQAIGAAYLIYLGGKHVYGNFFSSEKEHEEDNENKKGAGFWTTVAKIGIADIAFAIDSILAAVALAVTLPPTPLPRFGGMDGGQFAIIVAATVAGLILIKFAANWFVRLLDKRPGLETTAYMIVAWVGVKLAVITLAHPSIGVLNEHFVHSTAWKLTFWGVLIVIAVGGWFLSGRKSPDQGEDTPSSSNRSEP
ncbi:TerC family protein [Tuberibacillus sp. Marseille-P3662]|uniref:TerC family protein n=1 Tax=Tuberibacillus sp. Marseille-P3662 TaxID=1965358 RepID=UPI000A1CDA71|nr:TerC family protein [Tuberibacillus sp. Marseille-P3662]